jgi:DNA-binding NarL/FixJ family response regulator
MRIPGLTRRQQQVCVLRVGRRQLSQRQIARKLKISQPTVHQHLRAAVRKFPVLENLLFPSALASRRAFPRPGEFLIAA